MNKSVTEGEILSLTVRAAYNGGGAGGRLGSMETSNKSVSSDDQIF